MSFPDPQDLARQIIASAVMRIDHEYIADALNHLIPSQPSDGWTATVADLIEQATVTVHWSEVSDR